MYLHRTPYPCPYYLLKKLSRGELGTWTEKIYGDRKDDWTEVELSCKAAYLEKKVLMILEVG